MGMVTASNQTDQRLGLWGLEIMSCVHVTCRQWAKTVPEKEERHFFHLMAFHLPSVGRLLYGCVKKQMLGTFPHPSSL